MAKKKSKAKNKPQQTVKKQSKPISNEKGIQAFPNWGIALVLSFLTIILFSNTFNHGFTVDDPLVISENKIVKKGISALGEIWSSSYLQGYNSKVDAAYRPMSLSTFALEKSFFGGTASVMHIMHILYYALGIFLCYFFSLKLFKNNKTLAIITTLLYLAHPIHTEVVNNLKSRDEILMMLGIMGMGYYYLEFLNIKKSKYLIYALAFYFVALFSKETAVSFFLIIPLLYLWNQKVWNKEAYKHGAYFLGISIFYFLVRTRVVGTYDIDMDYMNNALLAAGDNIFQRFPDAIMLMGKYLVMLFFPYPLSVDYSYNSIPMKGWSSIWSYISLIVFGGLLFLSYLGIKKKKIYGVLIPWFLITMVVASNIFLLIGSTFAERFLFIPSFAFCAGLAALLYHLLNKKALYVGIVLAIVASIWTMNRNNHWKTDQALFTRDVQFQEENARVQTFYGRFTYAAAKDLKGEEKTEQYSIASKALNKATELAPDYMVANYYRGFLAKEMKDYDLASDMFSKVVELDPEFKAGRVQYAISLGREERHAEAVKEYEWLIKNGKKNFTIVHNIAFSHLNLRNYKDAEKYFLEAHNLKPNDQNVLSNLIRIYRDGLKDQKSAIIYNEKLKKLKG